MGSLILSVALSHLCHISFGCAKKNVKTLGSSRTIFIAGRLAVPSPLAALRHVCSYFPCSSAFLVCRFSSFLFAVSLCTSYLYWTQCASVSLLSLSHTHTKPTNTEWHRWLCTSNTKISLTHFIDTVSAPLHFTTIHGLGDDDDDRDTRWQTFLMKLHVF